MKLQRTLNPIFLPLVFVPVADVAAALLFFFLLSGGYLLQPGISVKVPESPFLVAPQRDPLVVAITGPPSPGIYFEDRRLTTAELRQALNEKVTGTRTVIIKPDRRAPAELLVEVVNTAVATGRTVVLATSPPEP